VDAKAADAAEVERMQAVMRRYSKSVADFMSAFLAPYQQRWTLDYASYRPIEEQGRDLATRKRNDLLHTDAFPTRPTRGARILRFFHNIHPTRTRDWVLGEPFARVLGEFVPGKVAMPHQDGALAGAGKKLAQAVGLAAVAPQLKRTPYDGFMMDLHNIMKEDERFQRECRKESFQFPAGSSWMVYTETVPHAVQAGGDGDSGVLAAGDSGEDGGGAACVRGARLYRIVRSSQHNFRRHSERTVPRTLFGSSLGL
jgi:hypothetical protein